MKPKPKGERSFEEVFGGIRTDLLLDRLDQTARWCGTRVDTTRPADCLRTLDYCRDPFIDRHTLVFWVAAKRARLLGEHEGVYKRSRQLPLSFDPGSLDERRGRATSRRFRVPELRRERVHQPQGAARLLRLEVVRPRSRRRTTMRSR